MKKHEVFGRTFYSTDEGKLIDSNGNATAHVTNELEVFIDSRLGASRFRDIELKEGDHFAFTDPRPRGAHPGVDYGTTLLIRDGRLHMTDVMNGLIMWD